jgi:hypothetical protein
MSNQIVTLNVTQTVAPAPSTLQQTGAFISQGGTTAAVNSLTLLTQASDLTAVLAAPLALTSLMWSTGVTTATTTAPHGYTVSQVVYLTIAGAVPAAFNGNYACTITGASTFTYAIASNPGNETTPGTYTPSTQVELQQQVATFFGQGAAVPIYILELGAGSVNAGVTALTTWINNNLNTVYAFLVPREWDGNASFISLIAQFTSTTSKVYFWITTTNATYSLYDAANYKAAFTLIEAPAIGVMEFTLAAVLWVTLNYNPSSTNQVPPLAFAYVYGVTAYPTVGNQTLFAQWKTAGVNIIKVGSEGGITNTCVFWGTTMDNNPFNYWYSADWVQINIDLDLSNAVINGSNNPQAPLYLNQQGINTLQAVGAATLSSAVTFGLLLGTVVQTELTGPTYAAALDAGTFAGQAVLNAVPFVPYFTANPSDYGTGTYNGFACTITPLRGFTSITFYVHLTNIVAL